MTRSCYSGILTVWFSKVSNKLRAGDVLLVAADAFRVVPPGFCIVVFVVVYKRVAPLD
jgi:hypothetical protein